MKPDICMTVLKGFHQRVDRRLLGLTARWGNTSEWECPPVATAMKVTGLWMVGECVRRRQATIAEYIAGRPIFEICMQSERREGSSRFLCWCDQDHGQEEQGIYWKEKRIVYLIQLSRGISLVRIGKGYALIYTSWYPNPFPVEIELNNNNNLIPTNVLRVVFWE